MRRIRYAAVITLGAVIVFVAAILIRRNILQHKATQRRQAAQRHAMLVIAMPRDNLLSTLDALNVRIEGDDDFKVSIARALAILAYNSPSNFTIITNNLQVIQMGSYDAVYPNMNPVTCMFRKTNVMFSATWTATLLVREALHADLYREFHKRYPTLTISPGNWQSWKLQKQCLAATIEAAREFGASDYEVDH